MPFAIAGIFIHLLIAAGFYILFPVLGFVAGGFVLLNFAGVLLMAYGRMKAGSVLYYIGCVMFIPTSMLGAFGAGAMVDRDRERRFRDGVPSAVSGSPLIGSLPRKALSLAWGILLTGIGFLFVTMTGKNGSLVGFGLLLVFISVWGQRVPLVRVHEKFLSVKKAMITPRIFILYKDIISWESAEKHMRLLVQGDGRTFELFVPLHDDGAEERAVIMKKVSKKLKPSARAALRI